MALVPSPASVHADTSAPVHRISTAPNVNFLETLAEQVPAGTTVIVRRHLHPSQLPRCTFFRYLSETITDYILLFLHARMAPLALRDND